MLINLTSRIPFPRPLVYATFRDCLVDLVPYIPSVKNIEIKSRQNKPDHIESINEWRGKGEIPGLLKPWIKEDLLTWTEYNIWKEGTFSLEWRIQTHAFTEAVQWAGINHFIDKEGTTLIESQGQLKIDPKGLKNIPPLMRSQAAQVAEKYLAKQVEPNLSLMSEGVRQYLSKQTRQ
ncbi:conserved hypothetical protein [Gloeothece citriformis PCC 7424]|uniref:Cyclase/dehydrase n=1 Tax=Gloeothece citriformis (strain PCC 7424) TaxID=65393 RepID=B7KBV4_GLOC7|nr:hypothetical protein [Gloeothece citriformis]ACK68777.1 conserved hypothetical protein [Gloeothece citriformis PCC 7424]